MALFVKGWGSDAPTGGASNPGDIAWMLTASGLVLLMTPGLSFFYGGMVSFKNVVSTMLQSLARSGSSASCGSSVGFSLAFGDDIGGLIGNPMTFLMFDGVGEAIALATSPEREPFVFISAPMQAPLATRLHHAALLILTLLVHGAALTSIGLALSLWFKRTDWAAVVSCAVRETTTFAGPLQEFISIRSQVAWRLAELGPIAIPSRVFDVLTTRVEKLPNFAFWAFLFDIGVAGAAAVLLVLAMRMHDRRLTVRQLPQSADFSLPSWQRWSLHVSLTYWDSRN